MTDCPSTITIFTPQFDVDEEQKEEEFFENAVCFYVSFFLSLSVFPLMMKFLVGQIVQCVLPYFVARFLGFVMMQKLKKTRLFWSAKT